jgi:hypothetical protein
MAEEFIGIEINKNSMMISHRCEMIGLVADSGHGGTEILTNTNIVNTAFTTYISAGLRFVGELLFPYVDKVAL